MPPPVFQRRRAAGAAGAAVAVAVSDVAETFQKGLAAFRDERWRDGYELLSSIAERAESYAGMPAVFYAYLGLGMASCDRRAKEGLELCRYALQLDPNNHESYLAAGAVYLILGRRDAAHRAVSFGLEQRPGHPRLLELRRQIGVRRKLTFPSLSRRNPLNTLTGRLRAALERSRGRRERLGDPAEAGEPPARVRERAFAQLARR